MLSAPLGVEFIIVFYALAIGGGACILARRALRWMWGVALALAMLTAWIVIPIPLLTVNRAVCPYGFDLDGIAVAISMTFTALVMQLNVQREISPSHRLLLAAGAAYPALRVGMGMWV